MTYDKFMIDAKKLHRDNYYLVKEDDIKSHESKIIIICNDCNYEHHTNVRCHINNKANCIVCIERKPWDLKRFLEETIIMHKDKYNYSNIKEVDITNKRSYVPIKCNKCLIIFYQRVEYHITRGHGCQLFDKE